MALRKQQRAAVGGIDVQPGPGGVGEIDNLRQRIHGAKVRGPGRGHDSKRKQVPVPHAVQRGAQTLRPHSEFVVHCYPDNSVSPKPKLHGRFFDGKVGHLGTENSHARRFGRQTPFLCRPLKPRLQKCIAGQKQAHVVGLCPSRGKGAARAGRESRLGSEPLDKLLLQERGHGRLVKRIHRLI